MKNITEIITIHEKNILVLIFFMALGLRLIAVMNLSNQYRIPAADAAEYDILAINLLAGKGYINSETGLPTSYRVPLYPLFLAFIYLIFGHNYVAVRVIQCILSALLCIIIFYIGKRIFNRVIGLLSASILVFYQPYIFYSYYGGPAFLLTETLFATLLASLILFLIKNLFVEFSFKNSIISGILIGILVLIKPLFSLFPIFLFGLLAYKNKALYLSNLLKKMLFLLAGFILVLLPWIVRNYFVHKAFVPFSIEGGIALLGGNNPYVRGGGLATRNFDSFLTQEERDQLSKMSEVQRSNLYRRHAQEFLAKNYKKLPKLYFKKLLVLWDIYITDWDLSGSSGRRRFNICYSIVLMFSLFGIAKSIKSKLNIDILLLILLFIYISIMTLPFGGDPRYRYPFEPYLIIFASVGVFSIYNSFKNKFLSSSIIFVIIGINLLIYAYSDLILNWARYPLRLMGM